MLKDPLSQVFSLLNVSSANCSRWEAGGDWALRFPALERIKFVALLRGACWIVLPDHPPYRLEPGDTFLLTKTPYVVASDPSLPPEDGVARFEAGHSVVQVGGCETVALGGAFVFDDDNARRLIDALPPFMRIPADQPAAAALRATLAMLDRELDHAQMGGSLMVQRLADILLIQALRAYVAQQGESSVGWIGALSDRRIGGALQLMHADARRGWTVGELAGEVAMSRSAFALRFKTLVGVAPLDYLRRWRMQLAEQALRGEASSVASVASTLGYSSQSAFGNAYKRAFGQSPRGGRRA